MASKLEYRNNWEADEYYVGGTNYTAQKRVTKLTKVRIGRKNYAVKTRRVSIPYNDMGNTYNGISDHYFVVEEVFGLKMEFDLNQIVEKKSVFAVEFETE